MFVNTLFMNVLSMSLAATFSFVLILFARKFLDKKVDVFKKSLLWIIFIIVLLVPINFSSRLSIKNLFDKSTEIVNFKANTAIENLTIDNGKLDITYKNTSSGDLNIKLK